MRWIMTDRVAAPASTTKHYEPVIIFQLFNRTCTRWIMTDSMAAPASAPTTHPAVPTTPSCCTMAAACEQQ